MHLLVIMVLIFSLWTPESSVASGIRKRRFVSLNSISGGSFTLTFSLSIPVGDFELTSFLPIKYDFSTGELTSRTLNGGAEGRSLSNIGNVFPSFLTSAENYINKMSGGLDGRACVLRTICEIGQHPEHEDGFIGELVNLVVNPSKGLLYRKSGNIYSEAFSWGSYRNDCSIYYPKCQVSLFQFLDRGSYGNNSSSNYFTINEI